MIRLLGVIGAAALATYFLDPVSGKRRRALLRDKMTHYRKEAREYARGAAKDLGNRAYGVAHEARGLVERRLGRDRQINL